MFMIPTERIREKCAFCLSAAYFAFISVDTGCCQYLCHKCVSKCECGDHATHTYQLFIEAKFVDIHSKSWVMNPGPINFVQDIHRCRKHLIETDVSNYQIQENILEKVKLDVGDYRTEHVAAKVTGITKVKLLMRMATPDELKVYRMLVE